MEGGGVTVGAQTAVPSSEKGRVGKRGGGPLEKGGAGGFTSDG